MLLLRVQGTDRFWAIFKVYVLSFRLTGLPILGTDEFGLLRSTATVQNLSRCVGNQAKVFSVSFVLDCYNDVKIHPPTTGFQILRTGLHYIDD